jgi:hypothetical protein
MNLELIHKTALISGSTKDIGFAIAGQLATPKEMVHYGMTKTAQLAVSRGPKHSGFSQET